MITRQNIRVAIGFLCVLILFSAAAGYQEYAIFAHGVQIQHGNGPLRPLTQAEIWRYAFEAAANSVMPGIISSVLLVLVATAAGRFLYAMPRPAAVVGRVVFGSISGFALSVFGLFLLGGWSPPFFVSCILAGVLSFLLFGNERRDTQQCASPNGGAPRPLGNLEVGGGPPSVS